MIDEEIIERIERIEAPPVEEPAEVVADEPADNVAENIDEPSETDEIEADDFEEPHERTLDEIAAELDIELSDLYNVKVPFTDPDGKRSEATLSEWKDRQQDLLRSKKLRADAEAERQRVSEQAMIADSMAKQLQERAIESSALIEYLNSWLLQDFDKTDWKALRESDPEMWAAKRIEAEERQRAIAAKRAEAERLWRESQNAQLHQQQTQRAAALQVEEAKLFEAMPDWADVRTDVFKYLNSDHGFSERDLLRVDDHRSWVLARKAMLYDRAMSAGDVAKKRIAKTAKRVLKPGPRRSGNTDKFKQLRANLKRTGSINDAAALYNATRAR